MFPDDPSSRSSLSPFSSFPPLALRPLFLPLGSRFLLVPIIRTFRFSATELARTARSLDMFRSPGDREIARSRGIFLLSRGLGVSSFRLSTFVSLSIFLPLTLLGPRVAKALAHAHSLTHRHLFRFFPARDRVVAFLAVTSFVTSLDTRVTNYQLSDSL